MDAEAVKPIAVTAIQAVELAATVYASIGEVVVINGFHGRASPPDAESLSCSARPEVVGFELCVMLACDIATTVWQSEGYRYRAVDFIEEMRLLTVRIGTPHTEAVGRDLVFYWPTIEVIS